MMLFWGLTGKACRCLDAVPTPVVQARVARGVLSTD
jgi:hypothetical protein